MTGLFEVEGKKYLQINGGFYLITFSQDQRTLSGARIPTDHKDYPAILNAFRYRLYNR